MHKLICLLLCIGLLVIGFTAITDNTQDGILNYCLDTSDDPEFCIRCQYKAINNLLSKYEDSMESYINNIKSTPTRIVEVPLDVKIIITCMEKFKLKKYNTHDWVKIEACCDFLSKKMISDDVVY